MNLVGLVIGTLSAHIGTKYLGFAALCPPIPYFVCRNFFNEHCTAFPRNGFRLELYQGHS